MSKAANGDGSKNNNKKKNNNHNNNNKKKNHDDDNDNPSSHLSSLLLVLPSSSSSTSSSKDSSTKTSASTSSSSSTSTATTTTTTDPALILSRMSAPTFYFLSGRADPEECLLFLRVVARHVDTVLMGYRGEIGMVTDAVEVIKAVGQAATGCQCRIDVSRSGIIPALAKICHSAGRLTTEDSDDSIGDHTTTTTMMTTTTSRKKQVTAHSLTPAHTELLQCCITASHYHYASRFLMSHPILSLPSRRRSLSGVTSETFLRFFYLSGMIWIGCDDFRRAEAAFGHCVTVPGRAVSKVTIDARKKSLLCRCLVRSLDELEREEVVVGLMVRGVVSAGDRDDAGGVPGLSSEGAEAGGKPLVFDAASHKKHSVASTELLSIPPSTSSPVSRFLSSAASSSSSSSSSSSLTVPSTGPRRHSRNYHGLGQYNDLVMAFAADDTARFASMRTDMSDLLTHDGNHGLARRCQRELERRLIRSLAEVYEVVSMDHVARDLGMTGRDEVEAVFLDMATEGTLSLGVTIDRVTGFVYFTTVDDGEHDIGDLSERMTACMNLAHRIKTLDTAMAISTKYQQVLVRNDSTKGDDALSGQGTTGPRGVAELDRPEDMD